MELDNDDKCYITEDTIVRFMLSRDKVISEEELKEIQDFAQFSYGKNLALYYLSFKARTEKEVREYLKKYDIDENMSSQVIANLKEDNWINDGQYAYAIINANQLSGDKGPYVLTQKLTQKGISKSTIEEILREFDFSEVAQRVANKLLKKYERKLPARALQDKIIQNLTNKGFSYSDAKSAFDELDSQVDQETTQELIQIVGASHIAIVGNSIIANHGNDIKPIFLVKVNNSRFSSNPTTTITFGNQCMIVDTNNGVFCCF